MVMKSDFTQKLLSDLRLRKERMAASQNSGQQRITYAADVYAYGNSRQMLKGTRETKTLDITKNMHRENSGSQRRAGALATAEASKGIVPYGNGHTSLPIDLSTALALTFNRIRRSSAGKVGGIINIEWPSNTRYPTLTRLQINDISKGIQKLSQVLLRTCSRNSLRIDGRSIELGTQLLKGALDLEESLRMLVSLQEASENMESPSPTRKTGVKLLEDGEDDDDDDIISKIGQKNVVNRAVFSFNNNSEKRVSASRAKSNIVAKLMGLEDLPPNTTQEIRAGRQAIPNEKADELVYTNRRRSTRSEFSTQHERGMQSSNMKLFASNNRQQAHREIIYMLPCYENHDDMVTKDRKSRWSEVESEKITHGARESGKSMFTPQEQKIYSIKGNQKGERRKDMREETKADTVKQKDEKGKENSKAKEIVIKDKLQRAPMVAKTHNKEEKRKLSRNTAIPDYHQDKAKELKFHEPDERNQHVVYNQHQAKEVKGVKTIVHHSSNMIQKLKLLQSSKPPATAARDERVAGQKRMRASAQQDNLGKSGKSSTSVANLAITTSQKTEKIDCSGVEEDESRIAGVTNPINMEVRSAQVPLVKKKLSGRKVHKGGIPRKHDEGITKSTKLSYKTEGQSTLRNSMANRTNQGEFNKISGNEGAELNINSMANEESQQQREALQGTPLPHPVVNEPQSSDEHDALPCVGIRRENFTDGSNQGFQPPEKANVKEVQPPKTVFQLSESVGHANTEILHNSKQQQQKPYNVGMPEQLTEGEVYLKQTLIMSPLFLHTSEALFKLNIPISILSMCDDHIHKEKESKLVLDCTYEILQRKGRRQGLSTSPHLKTVINPVTMRSLDDLVKQLHKDLEVLRCYDRKGRDKSDEADHLLKMLERDVNHSNPDASSMWELGWNETVFAYIEGEEVAREITSNILDDLIDEIAKDLLEGTNG